MAKAKKESNTETGGYDHRNPPKVPHHLEIHPRLGGGHHVQHHYHDPHLPGHEMETHDFGPEDGAAAMHHIAKHAGIEHDLAEKEHTAAEGPIEESEND